MNRRPRRAAPLACVPVERLSADVAGMLPLPPVPPAVGWRTSLRLPRDHYVRLDANDYSVHPGVIGRRVEVVGDLGRVRVCRSGRTVADHPRVWARHQTLSDPERVAAARLLRRDRLGLARLSADPRWSCAAWPTTTPRSASATGSRDAR